MRELSADDLGVMLSVFAVLLIAFGIDFHISKHSIRDHRRGAIVFSVVSLIGESATAIALVLTWVALWSPVAWARIDDLLVFVPGTVAMFCAVVLTGEKAVSRVLRIAMIKSARGGELPGGAVPRPDAQTGVA